MILYPTANFSPRGNVLLMESDDGPVIDFWDEKSLGTQPTQKQLDAVTQQQIDDYKIKKLRDDAKNSLDIISESGVVYRAMLICTANGELTTDSTLDEMKKIIQNKIDSGEADK